MKEILSKIEASIKEFEEKKKDLVKELRDQLVPAIANLMAESEGIHSISWRQYTPYFNDGDSCVFSANTDDLTVNDYNPDYDEYDSSKEQKITYEEYLTKYLETKEEVIQSNEILAKLGHTWGKDKIGEWGRVYNPNVVQKDVDTLNGITAILGKIPDEFLEEIFGDHVEITIRRDGTSEINSYDHD